MTVRPYCVCVPARNEAARLPILLNALAQQSVLDPVRVAICINNSDDGSARIVADAAQAFSGRLAITVVEESFPPSLAHAGSARRRALDLGLDRVGARDEALLISTDADARPPEHWLAANLAAAREDVALIGGALRLDEAEDLAPEFIRTRALWDRYWALVREIEDAIDPCPWDPAPRHGDHTGASLAVTVAAYVAAGRSPIVPTGEDRALVAAAQSADARLIHPPSVWTRVSARRVGRAVGGMADDMALLARQSEGLAPLSAPHPDHWRRRAEWRADLRRLPDGARRIAQLEPTLPPMPKDFDLRGLQDLDRSVAA